jgi:hypothetical protein
MHAQHQHNALNRARRDGFIAVEGAGWLCLTVDLRSAVTSSITMKPKRAAGGLSEGGIPFN